MENIENLNNLILSLRQSFIQLKEQTDQAISFIYSKKGTNNPMKNEKKNQSTMQDESNFKNSLNPNESSKVTNKEDIFNDDSDISYLIKEYLFYSHKIKATIKLVHEFKLKVENRKNLIKEKTKLIELGTELTAKELFITSKIHDSINLMRKYTVLKEVTTTEKNIIQSALNISRSLYQPFHINKEEKRNQIEFTYAHPNEHMEVKNSALFIKDKKCKDPIIIPSTNVVQKGSKIFIKYPDDDQENSNKDKSASKVYFKYLLFSLDDEFDEKIPSFCNGIKYNDNGIVVDDNLIIKAVACQLEMIDSNVVTSTYHVKSGMSNILYDENKINDTLKRDIITINQGNGSDIRPLEFGDNEESTPAGTDGSFYTGSIYKRKSNNNLYDEDEGI